MLSKIKAFLLIGLVCAAQSMGQSVSEAATPLPEIDKTIPGLDLMPPGSKLKNVSLPRYKGRELDMLLTSTLMTVVSPGEIAGEQVNVYLYDSKKLITTTMWMLDASYFFTSKIKAGLLLSRGETRISDQRFDAVGTGMIYDTVLGKCFMKGPVKTRFRFDRSNKKDSES